MAHVDAAPANEFGLLADQAAPWPDWFTSQPRTIVMQPTTFCNLDCGYCYLPDRQRKKDMSVRVATAVAASIPDSWSQVGAVEVVWHGGEPLAAGRRQLVELLEVFETLRVAGRVQHSLQTNATLITDAWCDIFVRYDIAVGVSLDGPRSANSNRIDRRGRPAFDRIVSGISSLRSRGIDYTAISVVSKDTISGAAEILDQLASMGCSQVGFNMEEKEGVNVRAGSPDLDQARQFWRQVFSWAAEHPTMRVREIERIFDHLSSSHQERQVDRPHDLIPTVGYDGDVVLLSPELLGARDPRYRDFVAGNVVREPLPDILGRASDLAYVQEFGIGVARCKSSCEFYRLCQGSHAGNRYFENGTFTSTETRHCQTSTQAVTLALHDISYPDGTG
jgi:uncharacterized protein